MIFLLVLVVIENLDYKMKILENNAIQTGQLKIPLQVKCPFCDSLLLIEEEKDYRQKYDWVYTGSGKCKKCYCYITDCPCCGTEFKFGQLKIMTDEKFKEAEKINTHIEQIKDELSALKKSERSYIRLYSDNGSHKNVNELCSIPSRVTYSFAFNYLTEELTKLKEQFKNL